MACRNGFLFPEIMEKDGSRFPFSHTIEDNNGELSRLLLPQGEQGFFRKRFEPAVDGVSNYELVSRFLMQASFGPIGNPVIPS